MQRCARHSGVSCSQRYGLGFWDSFVDFGGDTVLDLGADLADYSTQAFDVGTYALDVGGEFAPAAYGVDSFTDIAPVEAIDTTYEIVNDAAAIDEAGAYQASAPQSLPSIPRMPSSPTSSGASVLDTVLRSAPSVIQAGTTLLAKQGQIQAQRELAKTQAARAALLSTLPAGATVQAPGMIDKLRANFQANPVPWIVGGVSIALLLARGSGARRVVYRRRKGNRK